MSAESAEIHKDVAMILMQLLKMPFITRSKQHVLSVGRHYGKNACSGLINRAEMNQYIV